MDVLGIILGRSVGDDCAAELCVLETGVLDICFQRVAGGCGTILLGVLLGGESGTGFDVLVVVDVDVEQVDVGLV